ncbi:hypothetical protein C9J44_21500 [Photobacterium sp. GB-27]|uniref:hypothetical protein n=1 Tax=unclassified Photobacterium TaxID=2628852 RepID=UPI000D155E57|nr:MULTISPECIES: hypothetical protein [unclassified Photobacterium]PSV23146.1 hypothetical protein C9J42_20100 [Photobacterium sp. GB-56]PSV27994.1 hypothetical protein C9J44_21500 [Photobacterium sp. GB-27]PSV29968.1 hypothetical protein C9J40_15075 [Photobacterium sp. GB-72]PSV35163.1 hypothetical protein C9J38_16365 [Photobacterium sp. GB-210]PSV41190.1 hypothetical protein C9J46_19420 [Photobacterium sp. GB-36]
MTENIIVEISNHRSSPKKVSVKAYCNDNQKLPSAVIISLEQYESAGLTQSLTQLLNKSKSQNIIDKCKALLSYIADGATIRMNCYSR